MNMLSRSRSPAISVRSALISRSRSSSSSIRRSRSSSRCLRNVMSVKYRLMPEALG